MKFKFFILNSLLLAGCATGEAVRKHKVLIGTWECTGRVAGVYSPFYSGSPDLSLWGTDIEQDVILLVFKEENCNVFVNNELRQETFYSLEKNNDGTHMLDLTQFYVLPGESEPILHHVGALPLIWRSDKVIEMKHNAMGTLEFEKVK